MGSYVYPPLRQGEIRLLILGPRTVSGRINCRLTHYQLSECPPFDALSYCWGVSGKDKEIHCADGIIATTENLFQALQSLVYEHNERYMWADAVCINQTDEAEKGQQVSLMGEIYKSAEKTVVWLGKDKAIEVAISRVTEIQSCLEEPDQHVGSLRNRVQMLAPIFESQWFKRLWVVQEFALSRECLLTAGGEHVDADLLRHVVHKIWDDFYQNHGFFDGRAMVNFQNMYRIRGIISANQHRSGFFFLELLQQTEWFSYTEPKDRIYALLGLGAAKEAFPTNYGPDYSREAMFVDFTVWALSAFPDLAVLSYARGPELEQSRPPWAPEQPRPSWAPSNNMGGLPRSLLRLEHFSVSKKHHIQGATDDCRKKNTMLAFRREGNTLTLKGFFVDSVRNILDVVLLAHHPDVWPSKIYRAREWAYAHAAQGVSRDTQRLNLAVALTMGLSPSWGPAADDFIAGVSRYIAGEDKSDQYPRAFLGLLSTWGYFRYLCVTVGNRFAWVPARYPSSGGKPGDKICVFQGGRVPYVVREVSNGTYSLVGECWIQGFMHGEEAGFEGVEEEIIHLV